MARTNFIIGEKGVKFSNTFENNRFFGPIHIGFNGRCGGMVYTALDYFYNRIPYPDEVELPVEGSVLSTYISARQERSTLNTLDRWVELSFNPFGWRTSEFFNWGLQDYGGGRLQQLREEISRGRPAVLGLYNPSDMFKHHQVLAVGCDGDGADLKIYIYDPNYPRKEKVLRPHLNELRYYYEDFNPAEDTKWLTYFVDLNYRAQIPPRANEVSGCTGVNLSGRNMSGQNLSNKNYRCANITQTNFTGATINQTDFEDANGERVVFHGANLRNTNFIEANLNRANFYGADLKDTRFMKANIRNGVFTGADLKLANLTGATLHFCDFYGADLHRAILTESQCANASFYGASLNTANLERANFKNANLVGADLRNANLKEANFTGANVTGANLAGAIRERTIGLP
jgi:uncharacterized protein YjbI with pentapeptide repeats